MDTPFSVYFYSKDHPELIARELHTNDSEAALKFIRECRASGLYNRCDYDGRLDTSSIDWTDHGQ